MTQEEQEIMAAIQASQAEADKQKNQQLSEEEMIAKAIEESKLQQKKTLSAAELEEQ